MSVLVRYEVRINLFVGSILKYYYIIATYEVLRSLCYIYIYKRLALLDYDIRSLANVLQRRSSFNAYIYHGKPHLIILPLV